MLLLDKVHYRVTLWSMNNLCVPGKENIPALALNYTQGTGILRGNISWHHGLNAIAVICNGVAEKTSGSWPAASEAEALGSVPALRAKCAALLWAMEGKSSPSNVRMTRKLVLSALKYTSRKSPGMSCFPMKSERVCRNYFCCRGGISYNTFTQSSSANFGWKMEHIYFYTVSSALSSLQQLFNFFRLQMERPTWGKHGTK